MSVEARAGSMFIVVDCPNSAAQLGEHGRRSEGFVVGEH